MRIKVVSTGCLPPPIGGVTVFLKYFSEALKLKNNYEHEFFKFKRIFKYKKDFLHVNSSNPIKTLSYVIIGRFFFRKVFIVKHGGVFDLNNLFVMIALDMVDGVFCLNNSVQEQLNRINKNNFKHTTIFTENKVNISTKDTIFKSREKPKALIYINNGSKVNGKSVYGADFIIECLDGILENYELTVIDLSSYYKESFVSYSNINYIDEPQDFIKMLNDIDVYIRPTRTDGMSVALLEAGLCGVKCLASDIVERPNFVATYNLDNKKDFLEKLKDIMILNSNYNNVQLSCIDDVLNFMIIS